MADQLKRVLGIDTKTQFSEFGTFFKAFNSGQVGFFHWGTGPSYVDPHYLLSQLWVTGGSFNNRTGYSNPAFDRLIAQAEATPDDQARYKLYHEAERILLDDWAFCGTFSNAQAALVKPNVKGIAFSPIGPLPFAGVTIE